MAKSNLEDFWDWAESERKKRSLSWAAVERLGGVANAVISKRASNLMPPTFGVCIALSKAFDIPDVVVLRKARKIDYVPADDDNEQLLIEFYRLPDEDRRVILDQMRALRRMREEQARYEANP